MEGEGKSVEGGRREECGRREKGRVWKNERRMKGAEGIGRAN